jgi:hypothetical protein
MAGKTKLTLLDERLKEKEIEHKIVETKNVIKLSELEKLKVLASLFDNVTLSTNDVGTIFFESALNSKSREIIAKKIIKIVEEL